MISGTLRGKKFTLVDDEISCEDKNIYSLLTTLYSGILTGFKPQDGDPELYFKADVEKLGAKDVEHTESEESMMAIY